jgi:hypothetical protein
MGLPSTTQEEQFWRDRVWLASNYSRRYGLFSSGFHIVAADFWLAQERGIMYAIAFVLPLFIGTTAFLSLFFVTGRWLFVAILTILAVLGYFWYMLVLIDQAVISDHYRYPDGSNSTAENGGRSGSVQGRIPKDGRGTLLCAGGLCRQCGDAGKVWPARVEHGTQEPLKTLQFIGRVHAAAVEHGAELAAVGFGADKVAALLAARGTLEAANADQELFKGSRGLLTAQRIGVYNEVFRRLTRINALAQIVFADNYEMRKQFVFSPGRKKKLAVAEAV